MDDLRLPESCTRTGYHRRRFPAPDCGHRAYEASEQANEIAKTVRTVTNTEAPVQGTGISGAWPDLNTSALIRSSPRDQCLYDAWERSPVRFEDSESHAEEIIDVGFPGDPLLCVGLDNYDFTLAGVKSGEATCTGSLSSFQIRSYPSTATLRKERFPSIPRKRPLARSIRRSNSTSPSTTTMATRRPGRH